MKLYALFSAKQIESPLELPMTFDELKFTSVKGALKNHLGGV